VLIPCHIHTVKSGQIRRTRCARYLGIYFILSMFGVIFCSCLCKAEGKLLYFDRVLISIPSESTPSSIAFVFALASIPLFHISLNNELKWFIHRDPLLNRKLYTLKRLKRTLNVGHVTCRGTSMLGYIIIPHL
jgi:hypothetical protein